MPIRKGDGTGLTPKGFAEVRKGDGTVIYSAGGGTLIDDFEDNDLAEYDLQNETPTTQGTTVYEGAYALECNTGVKGLSGSSAAVSNEGAGLPYYPQPGDTFEIWVSRTGVRSSDNSGVRPRAYFGVQNTTSWPIDDGYGVLIGDDYTHSLFDLEVWSAGSVTRIASSTAYKMPPNEWHRLEIDWASDGTITVTLEDSAGTQQAQISATDTTYTAGGICGSTSVDTNITSSGTGHFDLIQVI